MLTVNVGTLNTAFKDGSHVDPQKLVQKGIIKTVKFGVKILGDGELGKKLNVKAHSFSRSAKAAILKQGGKVEIISLKQK